VNFVYSSICGKFPFSIVNNNQYNYVALYYVTGLLVDLNRYLPVIPSLLDKKICLSGLGTK